MSHEITVRADGTAEAAFAEKPAWHGLGTVFEEAMPSKETIVGSGLGWSVVQRPMAIGEPVTLDTAEGHVETYRFTEVPGMLANVREDTGLFLGSVTDQYQVVQNVEAFQFLDALVENREMRYESAFSLRGGKQVVLLGRLPQTDDIAAGDRLLRYVLLSLCHDGMGSIRFGPTSVRVVCANTYKLAIDQGHTKELAIRHTGNIAGKLKQARHILGLIGEEFDRYTEAGKALAAYRLAAPEWIEYLDIMCPQLNQRDPDYTKRRAAKIAETRDAIRACYHNERQQLPGIEGSAWAAFCATTEYIDHLPRRGATQTRKAEARFNVCLYGPGRDMKERAFQAACRFAGVAFDNAG